MTTSPWRTLPNGRLTMSGSATGAAGTSWTRRLHAGGAHAIYLHIPFCARKCAYCDFASWATPSGGAIPQRYARAIGEQVKEAASLGLLDECETAYIGGGTPTLLGEGLGDLIRVVTGKVPGLKELTCEANPDSLSDAVLADVAAAGCTRLSIGVQSLRDAELAQLGRIHDASLARDRVRAAVASGLDVSCDLMCAIPLQTSDTWEATLGEAVSLGVGHVSVYPLQIEEGTALEKRVGDEQPPWNSPDIQAERMKQAQAQLDGYGFHRYEVASYARSPEEECGHNKVYWAGRSYLGLGTGAASMLTAEGYQRILEVCPQLGPLPKGVSRVRLKVLSEGKAIADGARLSSLSFEEEFLTERQAAAEDLMLGARLACGLDFGLVSYARAILGKAFDQTLERLRGEGYLDGSLAPTEKGWLLGNELYGELWNLAGDTETLVRRSG